MSDLESVDLSQESEGEASEEMQLSPKTQPLASTTQQPRNAIGPSTPQRTSPRTSGPKPANTDTQNGTPVTDKRRKEHPEATNIAPKPTEDTDKPAEGAGEAPQTAPPKAKRGRPRKIQLKGRLKPPNVEPVAPSKPAPATKSTALPNSTTTEAVAPSEHVSAPNHAAKPATKPASGEVPRGGGRGRKRRLLTRPVETTQAEHGQEKTPGNVTSGARQLPSPENGALPQKQVPKPTERKLYGAAKASALKRRREEEEAKKKDAASAAPEVSEIPASHHQKGRPPKRARRQQTKDVTPTVPQEVIRIEDDDSAGEAMAVVPSAKDAVGQQTQKSETPQGNEKSFGAATANAVPSVGRQSLPSSFARPVGKRSKTRNAPLAANINSQLVGTDQDLLQRGNEESSPDKVRDQTRNEIVKPAAITHPGRPHAGRHSTGNIGAMDTDNMPDPDADEHNNIIPNSEAVKSMLDEIQRNAIPFLLAQDGICDSFSTRIGEDVDIILKNSDNDMFQVFSDRVKDALVADRLRLAVASAKTDLRRGIEQLLREFARKVGAPLGEADSSLLLRNEAFRNQSTLKEQRRVSKSFRLSSPKLLKPFPTSSVKTSKAVAPRRLAEESHHHEDTSGRDDLSDAADPLVATSQQPLKADSRSISNVADLKRFVGYSYDNLNLQCYRSCAILKLCAQPGGMTLTKLHEITPLGRQMIRKKVKDLLDCGYLVEDVIREEDKLVTVYSTAAHISDA